MANKQVIAIDLGAASGRVMQVAFDGQRLGLTEAHRFPNIPVTANGTLYWDALSIWDQIQTGIGKVEGKSAALGLDCWGVDFALLDRNGDLVSNPVHYRDLHKEGAMDWVFARVPRRTIFERTGIQFLSINGLYQLASLKRDNSPHLEIAKTLLTIADLFNYWLSGSLTCEFTEATTLQCYNPRTGRWDYDTLKALDLPSELFPQIVSPGTKIGDYQHIPVIAPACHDTGSAVVAVPTVYRNSAYLSSGTWSLIGMELDEVLINDAVYEANLTNEGGFGGTYRLLKNVAGMWLVQQSMQTWANQGKTFTYEQLNGLASQAKPFISLIDPDDSLFLPAGDMPSHIREFCARTQQPLPQDEGHIMRTIYESLAMKYRFVLEKLASLAGQEIKCLHIIGGGSQNTLLCQMTADAIGREVVAGPVEATALGNAIVQLITLGEFGTVAQAREVVQQSFPLVHYAPQNTSAWDEAYGRFKGLITST
jgi:rhamnulokinase